MYGPVANWLKAFLRRRHPRSRVLVGESHNLYVSHTIRRLGVAGRFPQSELWNVKVDIVGVVVSRPKATLAIVECEARHPTLRDLCQLLGYARLMKPQLATLVSPCAPSKPLGKLLCLQGRYDILEYDSGRRLKILRWLPERNDVDSTSIIPPGEHF